MSRRKVTINTEEVKVSIPNEDLQYADDGAMLLTLGGGADPSRCLCTPKLVHNFSPCNINEKKWSMDSLTRSKRTQQYTNPDVETEFLKFSNRDAMSTVVACGYAIVTGSWPFLWGKNEQEPEGIALFLVGVFIMIGAVVLGICHFWFSTPVSDRVAYIKMFVTTGVSFLATAAMAVFTTINTRDCHAKHLRGEPSFSKHCVDRIFVSFFFAVVGCALFMKMRAVPNVVCSLGGFVLWFVMYFFIIGLAGILSWQKNLIKTAVMALGCLTTALIGVRKDQITREQFEQNLHALIMTRELEIEKMRTYKVLTSLLPSSVIHRMVEGERIEDPEQEATVFFSDIQGFTQWSQHRSPQEIVQLVSILCVKFDAACQQYNVEKVKTIGDAYWAVCGLPTHEVDHAENTLEFAIMCLQIVQTSNEHHPEWGGVRIRIGIHTGYLSGGVLGSQQLSYEIFGGANDVAQKVEQEGVPMAVCCTAETKAGAEHQLEDFVFLPHKKVIVGNCEWETFIVRTKGQDLRQNQRRQQRRQQQQDQERDRAANLEVENLEGSANRSASRRRDRAANLEVENLEGLSASANRSASRSEATGSTAADPASSQASSVEEEMNKEYLHLERRRRRRNSKISRTSGQSIDELRIITQKFLKNRRAEEREYADAQMDEQDAEEKVSDIVREETRSKWRYCLWSFANSDVEAEYLEFSLQHLRPLREAGSLMFVILCGCVILSIALDHSGSVQGGWNFAALAVCVVALVCAVISGAASFGKLPHMVAPVVGGIGTALFVVAVGLTRADDTAPVISPGQGGNVLANDPGWITITLFVLYGFAALSWFSFPMILTFQTASVGIPLFVMYKDSSYFWENIWVFVTLTLASLPIAAVFERSIRQQFVDHKMFHLQLHLKEREGKEFEELISHTIPKFIAPQLRQWVTAGSNISQPLSVQYNSLAVAFIKFETPSFMEKTPMQTRAMSASGGSSSVTMLSLPVHPPLRDPPATGSQSAHSSVSGRHSASGELSSSLSMTPTMTGAAGGGRKDSLSRVNTPSDAGQRRESAAGSQPVLNWNYMCAIQETIETQLNSLKHIVKIKTIGNTTLLAGPVDPKYGLDENVIQLAVAELVNMSLNLRVVEALGNVRVGLHVGSVQGVILGIDRMTFDILGPAVNKAARCMGARQGKPSDVLATREFVKCYIKWRETKQFGESRSLVEKSPTPSGLGRSFTPLGPLAANTPASLSSGGPRSLVLRQTPSRRSNNQASVLSGSGSFDPDQPPGFSTGGKPEIFVQGPSGDFPPPPGVNPARSLSPMVPVGGSPITSRDEAPEVGQGSMNNLPIPSLLSDDPMSSDQLTRSGSPSNMSLLHQQQLHHFEFVEGFEEDLKGIGPTTLYRIRGIVEGCQERRSRQLSAAPSADSRESSTYVISTEDVPK